MKLINYKAVTAGTNGYQTPEVGAAIFANSLEELKELAAILDEQIHEFHWKDGWGICEAKIPVYDFDNYFQTIREELSQAGESEDEIEDAIHDTGYDYDTHHYELGILLKHDDYDIDWENETAEKIEN